MIRPFANRLAVVASAVGLLAASASARVDSLITVIDFEDIALSDSPAVAISTQYAGLGVTFSIEGDPTLFPILVQEGAPAVAFSTPNADSPLASGSFGMTDPVINGSISTPRKIRIKFDPPVSSASFYVTDLDLFNGAPESLVATAYNGRTEVDSISLAGTSANDGKSVPVSLSGASITSVLIDPVASSQGGIGWAMDFLTISRPCPTPDCTPRFRLSQESAPNAGDFASHILGEVSIWVAPETSAASFYGYGVPEQFSWNGAAFAPIAQRSHLLGAITTDGPTLIVVHDQAIPDDPDGGKAEMRVEVVSDTSGAALVVEDDPESESATDVYTGQAGANVFTSKHEWGVCCSDGFALGSLACGSSLIVKFTDVDNNGATPAISGLDDWVAYGADGSQIPLALVADQRVRIDLLPPASCPADFTCDGLIGADDLGVLLGAWGQTLGAQDIDGSGLVDALDIGVLLGLWGPCP